MGVDRLFRRFAEEDGFDAAPTVVSNPAAFALRPVEEVQSRITAGHHLVHGGRDELHRLAILLNGMPHAGAIADIDGVVIHAYAPSTELIAVHGRPVGAQILVSPQLRAALCDGRPGISDGPAPERTAVYLALQGTDKSVLGFLAFGCARDCLDEQVAATVVEAARIISLAAQLDQLRQHHEKVIGLIGHELRQPLSALMAAFEVVRRNMAMPRPRSFEIAHRQLSHMGSLVDSLLDLSRVLSGKLRITREPADVRTILLFALESVKNDIESRAQVLHLEIPDRPVWCSGDAARLQQVFVNLLTNAQRYTPHGGAITLTLESGDELRVSFNDDGPGIAHDARDQIFQPFMQKAETGSGLGLGLSISRRLVELHGGTLTVHDGDGGIGSRFVVTLPCAREKRAQQPSVSS